MSVTTKRRKHGGRQPGREPDGVPTDRSDAPIEGSEAGDAQDLREAARRRPIRDYHAAAKRHFYAAKKLVGRDARASEREARLAIDAAVRAFWWAEDTDLEDEQHRLMHDLGKWTRERFGCWLHFEGSRYTLRCPIAIAHKRLGFSVGYTGTLICSICGGDVSECPHMPDRAYWVRGGPNATGRCPVCGRKKCDHRPDRLYRAAMTRIVTQMRLREVSMVSRPAGVETRLTEIPVDTDGLQQHLGSAWKPGMPVSCDRCLGGLDSCLGFTEFDPVAHELEGSEIEAATEKLRQ
jgi:hypothetical protein